MSTAGMHWPARPFGATRDRLAVADHGLVLNAYGALPATANLGRYYGSARAYGLRRLRDRGGRRRIDEQSGDQEGSAKTTSKTTNKSRSGERSHLVSCPFRKFHPAWIRIVRQNHRWRRSLR